MVVICKNVLKIYGYDILVHEYINSRANKILGIIYFWVTTKSLWIMGLEITVYYSLFTQLPLIQLKFKITHLL